MALVLAFVLATIFGCAIGLICSGELKDHNITEDVFVRGKCTLSNVGVTGGIFVENGAELITAGPCTCGNTLKLKNAGKVYLGGSMTISAGVEAETAKHLTIGKNVKLGGLMLSHTPSVISGTVTRIFAAGNGSLTLTDATVSLGGLFASELNGLVKMCGTSLKGGIEVVGGTAELEAVAGEGCAPNELEGTIRVLDTMGAVRIIGGTLNAADIIVEKIAGTFEARSVAFSDAKFVGVKGDLLLKNCVLDSDATFEGTMGKVVIDGCVFDGDLSVSQTDVTNTVDFMKNMAAVIIRNSNFMLEDVFVGKNMGKVILESNKQFGAKIEGNGAIELMNNAGTDFELIGNEKVKVMGNDVESVSCVGNMKVGDVSGNSVINGAPVDDQCKIN